LKIDYLFGRLHADVAGNLLTAADMPLAIGLDLCAHLTVIVGRVLAIMPVGVVGRRKIGPLAEFAVEDSEAQPDRVLTSSHFCNEFVLLLRVNGDVITPFVAAVDSGVGPPYVLFEQLVAFVSVLKKRVPFGAFRAPLGWYRLHSKETDYEKNSEKSRQRHD